MSTTSGTTDISVKYQRLAAEFVKIRNQVNVLKTAVIEEQHRSQKLQQELAERESTLRKIGDENESLTFRNGQLVKRVEALQQSLDDAAKTPTKGKKKQREANLRLFVDLGPSDPHSPGPSMTVERRNLLEKELERKVTEVSELHSKIFDLEQERSHEFDELNQQITALRAENDALRCVNHTSTPLTQPARNVKCHNCQNSTSSMPPQANSSLPQVPASNSNDAVPWDLAVPHDAKLYATGLITVSKQFLNGFSTVFTLLEQRSTLYPYDASLEVLPDSFKEVGSSLLHFAKLLNDHIDQLDTVQVKVHEEETLLFKIAEKVPDGLATIIRDENQVPFCDANLEETNNQFEQKLRTCVSQTAELLAKPLSSALDPKSRHVFIDRIRHLSSLCQDLDSLMGRKVLFEKNMPTSSKRLKCVNECTHKGFQQVSHAINRALGMCSDFQALEHLRTSVAGLDPEEIPVEVSVDSNGDSTNEDALREAHEKVAAQVRELTSKLAKALKEKSECEGLVAAAEHELDVLRKLRGDDVQAVNETDAESKSNQDYLETFYKEKLKQLAVELRFVRGELAYYKEECDALLISAQLLQRDQMKASEPCTKCDALSQTLDEIRATFEGQMRQLYDQLADQAAELDAQRDQLQNMRSEPGSDPTPSRENSFKRNIRRMVGK